MAADAWGLVFNIKAVVRETGIPADTLRAWERRYGVPRPERSAGRQRIYSRRDIQLIKWLLARQSDGLSISRAIALWREMTSGGQDPVDAGRQAPSPVAEQSLESLRGAWLRACMGFREQAADTILAQAYALYPTEVVCGELLQKGLAEAGQAWFEGSATVQQEHFTSCRAIHQLERLIAASPLPYRRERVLVACPAEEQHTFAPLFITLFLRRRGWDTLYLGACVPVEQMDLTVAEVQPGLAILSAQRLPTAEALIDTARVLDRLGVMVGYGGLVFNLLPNIRSRVPGHFLGEELTVGVQAAERLLLSPKPHPPVQQAPDPVR